MVATIPEATNEAKAATDSTETMDSPPVLGNTVVVSVPELLVALTVAEAVGVALAVGVVLAVGVAFQPNSAGAYRADKSRLQNGKGPEFRGT
jgi:hypothetical protein